MPGGEAAINWLSERGRAAVEDLSMCVCVCMCSVKMSVLGNTGAVPAHFGFSRGLEFCLGHFGSYHGSLQEQPRHVGGTNMSSQMNF